MHRTQPARFAPLASLTGLVCAAAMIVAGCHHGSKAAAKPGTPGGASAATPAAEEQVVRNLGPVYALGYRLQWRGYPQVGRGAGVKFLDVLGDVVAVQDGRNVLTVMEPSNGANRWSLDMGSSLSKFVGNARIDDKLMCSSEYEVQVLDIRTGQIKARQHLAALANTPPVVQAPILIYGSSRGEILAHNSYSSHRLWEYKLAGSIRAKPIMVGDSVAAVSQAGDVIFLDPRTGESGGRRRGIFGGLENELVANDSTLFIASTDQSIWAISSSDAKTLWRVRTPDPLTAQPALNDGKLYQYVPSWGFTALDAGTGEKVWSKKDIAGSLIAVRAGKLLVWDKSHRVGMLLDPKNGDVLEKVEMPEAEMIAFDAFVDGNAYVAKRDGSVEKYSPR